MDFEFSKELTALKKEVYAFVEEKIRPIADQLDKEARFPRELFAEMGKRGYLGLPFSEEYGGKGMGTLAYMTAAEEIARASLGVALSYVATISIGTEPIARYGSPEQKEKFLRPLAEGRELAAFGLTEKTAGSDAKGIEMTAEKVGDDYILNGTKQWITNANYASIITVAAITGYKPSGEKIISAIVVPMDTAGITVTSPYDKMGARSSDTGEITFKNVRVPKENLLGQETDGLKQLLNVLNGGRISIAAISVGLAQDAFDKALQHSGERVQFGGPIRQFESVQFKLADMLTETEAARLLVQKASLLKDSGETYIKEAAMAKVFASETATKNANRAMQILGGTGYMRPAQVERLIRDAKILEIGEGTSEIQRLVIARQLFKEEGENK
ncbi:acyl-CoA dehydrogenase family protein [Listeria valentina]|uniref:acyl-CoA dehydrogenase family protein n=1 Tax=Listeria valentina TaxID=2705293 RepID=UPI00142FDD11|nr:acyl-CoA dehydrogenase family protein [Listeria valentina]